MTSTVERKEPASVRQARARMTAIDTLIAEAAKAVEDSKLEVATLPITREAAKARGDHAGFFAAEEAALKAASEIDRRRLQIARLRAEREILPQIVTDFDERCLRADRLREEIEGYERLAAIDLQHEALTEAVEGYQQWAASHVGAPATPQYLGDLRHKRGSGQVDHLRLGLQCNRDRRQQLAEIEKGLSR